MAALAEMTSRDFSGKFVMNKALSEKEQDILKMQGVGWAMRKTISLAAPHLAIKHYTDASSGEHIVVEQTVPGLRSNTEHRVLDWSQKKVDGPIFGALVTQNRRVQADELETGWLKDGLCPETFVDRAIVHTLAQSDSQKDRESGSIMQTWGFEHIGGGKRYVRRVSLVGSTGEAVQARSDCRGHALTVPLLYRGHSDSKAS